jgi:hypothetical protein
VIFDCLLLQAHNLFLLYPHGFGHTAHEPRIITRSHPSPSRTYRPRALVDFDARAMHPPSRTYRPRTLVDFDARATHPPSLSQMYGPCTLARRPLFMGQRPGLVVHMHAESMPHIVPHSPQTCCRRVDTHMYAHTTTTMHTRTHARRQHIIIRLDATHVHSDNDDVHGETTTAHAHTGRADEAAAASCTVQTQSDR